MPALINNSRRSLFTYLNPSSYISEKYRILKSNILLHTEGRNVKTILVTSAEGGEGKTTTAVNLAILLTEEKQRVLLIDADFRGTSLHQVFNKPNKIGLANVLADQNLLQQAIQDTHIDRLSLLASGTIPSNPAELFSGPRLERAFELIKPLFDVVVIDSPPVLEVTDSLQLSSQCDGWVLILRKGKSKSSEVANAIELLKPTRCELLGAVLNHR
jgi:capsular exopolysaccharide synthesis family protein